MSFLGLLKRRNILCIYLGQTLSSIGDWFFRIALPLIIYNQTKSPLLVAVTATISTLPFFIFAPLGGVIADRSNRRKILISTDLLRAAIFFIMFLTPARYLVEVVIIGGFFVSVCDRFFGPAIGAIMPNLVKKDELPLLNSLSSMTGTTLKLTVPALAAAIVGVAGVKIALIINCLSFFGSLIGCLCVSADVFLVTARKEKLSASAIFTDMKEGVRELLKNNIVWGVVLTWMIVWVGSAPYTTLMVVFIKDTLQQSDYAFGLISSISALGMLVGGWLAAWLSQRVDIWRLFVVGLFLIALGAAILAFSQNFTVASFSRFIAGMGIIMSSIAEITIIQGKVPSFVRGRVLAFSDIALQGVSILSMALVSLLIAVTDIRTLFYLSALIFFVATIFAFFFDIKILKNNKPDELPHETEPT